MKLQDVKWGKVLDKYKMLFILLLMIVLMSFASNVFLSGRNIMNIIRQISVNTVIAVGMTFVIITGGIDLSAGAILAVSGVVAAALVKSGAVSSIFLVAVIASLAGGVLGLLNGFSIAKLKVPPFISTLAMMQSARGIAYLLSNGRPIVDLPKSFLIIGQENFLGIPVMILLMILVVIIGYTVLQRTKFGRYVYYVGGNEEAARVSGINVSKLLITVYTIAGICAGFAGVILASRINSGQPQAGLTYELYAIAAVVIGGTSLNGGIGSMGGTLIGACIIGIIRNSMNLLNVSPFNQMVVLGIVILLAVILDMQSSKKTSNG
ncbi:MAG: ABC transporter permease [Spirochaetales bacterium]|nr:ABC transporter permease [Spirochaetales bacterium]